MQDSWFLKTVLYESCQKVNLAVFLSCGGNKITVKRNGTVNALHHSLDLSVSLEVAMILLKPILTCNTLLTHNSSIG